MATIYRITTPYGHRYDVAEDGRILVYRRADDEAKPYVPGPDWTITGVVSCRGFAGGFGRSYGLAQLGILADLPPADLLYKNGSPRWTLSDLDHGTRRIHGNTKYHGIKSIVRLRDTAKRRNQLAELRDITDRLSLFMGGHMEIRRLALNMNQVEEYNPPPNPAKLTDSRAAGYLQLYGDESWELDALEPAVLAGLIRDEITSLQESDAWEASVEEEEKGRAELAKIADRYEDVTAFLEEDL